MRCILTNTKKARETKRDLMVRNFWKGISQDEFVQALESSSSEKMGLLRNAMCDPDFHRYSLVQLCRHVGANIIDLYEAWRSYQHSVGLIRALGHVPDILDDIAVDARAKDRVCPTCRGTGQGEGGDCLTCDGQKIVRVSGDTDSRKIILEATGITGKGRGVNININNTIGKTDSMEDVINITGRILGDKDEHNDDEDEASGDGTSTPQ